MNGFSWTVADYLQAAYVCLTALGIVVTAFMAVWVVRSVQRKIDNEQMLRDHFAHEVIELRKDTRDFMTKVITGGMHAKEIKRCHYRLSSHINDLLALLNKKYKVDKKYLKAYRQNVMKIIEDDGAYTQVFDANGEVTLNSETVTKLHEIEVKNDHLFNDVLLKIYEQNG